MGTTDTTGTPERAGKTDNVLVVANEAIEGSELAEAVLDHLSGRTVRIYLIAPALVDSGLDHELGEVDHAFGPTQERLEHSLAALRRVGIEAAGAVADADPMVAISDELRKFDADEIVLISHTKAESAYAEKDLFARVNHDFSQPITQLTVTRADGDGHKPADGDGHETAAANESGAAVSCPA